MTKVLSFVPAPEDGSRSQIGRVHPDGSITFRGLRYPTVRDLPSECKGLRPDLQTHRQWREIYGPIDPKRKRWRWRQPPRK